MKSYFAGLAFAWNAQPRRVSKSSCRSFQARVLGIFPLSRYRGLGGTAGRGYPRFRARRGTFATATARLSSSYIVYIPRTQRLTCQHGHPEPVFQVASMSLSSSPQQIVQAQLGRRFATIPKDQLQILDRDGAWAIDPSDRQGVPQVPHHILQDITSYHLMQIQAAAADQTLSATEDVISKDHHSRQHHEDNEDEAGVDNVNEANSSSQEQEEDEGSLISGWSVSPTRESSKSILAPQAPKFQSQLGQATPQVDQPDANSYVSQHTVPTPAPRRNLHHVETTEEVDEYEEEMEVDLPGARQSPEARVNFDSARVQMASTPAATAVTQITRDETPSCAQPDQRVIPGTILTKQPSLRPEKEPERRKHRRMQPIQFEGTMPVKRLNSLSVVRLPAVSRLAEVDSSMSTSSSSLIPATCATKSTQNSAAGRAATSRMPTTEQASRQKTLHQSYDITSKHEPSTETFTSQTDQKTPHPNDLYSLFKSAYPSYTTAHAGTLKNFIKAILCLEYLQSERALHEFLYDDFIRAFSSAYLHYVRNAGPGQEALPAIEWFNLRDGQPEFSKMVIIKRNVNTVLEQFPDEVSLARQFIGSRPQKEKALPRLIKRLSVDKCTDVSMITCRTPDGSTPGTARHSGRPSIPSPQLGSDAPELPRLPPTSSARSSKKPSASRYFERMKSASRTRSAKLRSADLQARLREHFRRTSAKRTLDSAS